MTLSFIHQRSIKTRVMLFTLLIFIGSIWALEFYASRMLRDDMRRLLGEQQFATASALASVVNRALGERQQALETIARKIPPTGNRKPGELQSLLESLPILQSLFNGGVVITDAQGTAIAEFPRNFGRVGKNFRELPGVAAVLHDAKAIISPPMVGQQVKVPFFAMGVPILDANGAVIGLIAGVIRLDQPNFLDQVIQNFHGQDGGYLLVAPRERLIITASDKTRIMESLPAEGVSPTLDRFLRGYEGSDVFINPRGIEVLASARRVALSGWDVAVTLPITVAFAPVRDMQRRMLYGTLALTLLAAGLTGWMLRRELSPLLDAAATLAQLPAAGQSVQPLQIARHDEVGRLVSGFNRLLESLAQREEALQESETRFRTLMEQIPGVAVQAYAMDGTVTFWNHAAETLYGYTAAEATGANFLELIVPPEMREGMATAMQHMAQTGDPIPASELLLQAKGGARVPVFSSHALLKPVGKPLELFCLDVDLSETKKAQELVRQLAFYDALTGLPNRRLLEDRLNQTMAASKRSGLFAALMFLDLDNFKPLNDVYGHSVGDLLLIEVARRLSACVREMDTVARFGGDEFVVMLGELEANRAQSIVQATAVAEKIRTSIAAPYQLTVTHAGQPDSLVEHHCSASIGVVVFTNHEASLTDILQWADAAMYQAKDAGRNTVRFHSPTG